MEGLSAGQLNWRPAEGSWSIAECIDHLNTANQQYATSLEAAIAKGKPFRPGSKLPKLGWLERWFLNQVEPPVKRKTKAPTKFLPAPKQFQPDELVERWRATHQRLAVLAEQAEGLDLARTKVTSPVSSLIKLSLLCVLQILPAHDRRHLWQASDVRRQLPGPG